MACVGGLQIDVHEALGAAEVPVEHLLDEPGGQLATDRTPLWRAGDGFDRELRRALGLAELRQRLVRGTRLALGQLEPP